MPQFLACLSTPYILDIPLTLFRHQMDKWHQQQPLGWDGHVDSLLCHLLGLFRNHTRNLLQVDKDHALGSHPSILDGAKWP